MLSVPPTTSTAANKYLPRIASASPRNNKWSFSPAIKLGGAATRSCGKQQGRPDPTHTYITIPHATNNSTQLCCLNSTHTCLRATARCPIAQLTDPQTAHTEDIIDPQTIELLRGWVARSSTVCYPSLYGRQNISGGLFRALRKGKSHRDLTNNRAQQPVKNRVLAPR